jgi:benzoyl-CoA reductase/2-hydroxyglutaryl-CoA dehydratase subunit BcrC/BadD/HgdB
MTAIEELKAAYRQRDAAARAWKASGGKVVAYLDDTVPEEMIEAAGFLPYRISGDPRTPPDSLKKYLFPFWKKHSLSDRQLKQGINNSMLDLIFRGRYDFVDYLVIAYSRKNFLAFWHQLTDAKRHYPDLEVPQLYVLDRAITPFFESSLFNRERIYDFKAALEDWSGKPLTDAALSAAIAARNENRALLGRLMALRTADPPKLSGVEALEMIGSAQFMPIERNNKLLKEAIAEVEARPGRPGRRVFAAGSPCDNTDLYALIESCGATVVGEDHTWGARVTEYPTRTDLEPLEALGDRYHKKPPAVLYPLSKAISECRRRAVESGAEAAVFNVYAFDNHQLWDIPDERRALEDAGIATLYLQEQPYLITDEAGVKGEVRRLLDILKEPAGSPA